MTSMFFTVDERDIVILKGRWDGLAALSAADISVREHVFQNLKESYLEAHRFYHNLSHIKLLLQLLESCQTRAKHPDSLRFSIWFHDVVYDPRKSDNEEASARLAADSMLELGVDTSTRELVQKMILATKGHQSDSSSEDTKLFLDLDLSILGMTEEIYQQYRKVIREEYSWVSDALYREGRSKVLKSFLDRERIYATAEMNQKYELQARKNIDAEIESLGSS